MRWPRLTGVALITFSLLGYASEGISYELRTHREITAGAFNSSSGVANYLEALGIKAGDSFDPSRAETEGQLDNFENSGSPRDWMIYETMREDDYQRHPVLESMGCDTPQNPVSQIDRPLNHFLDVQRGGRGLTAPLVNGIPAPDWALGRQGRGPSSTQNQFSVLDAREYQAKSLTDLSKRERDKNTALLFRTLGHVLHLLQDMAQPQHTRNDPHSGCLSLIAGEHSWYEDYINARALGATFRSRSDPTSPLPLGGYSAPSFTGFQDFWANAELKGLADFSSRNFFSAGTNLSLSGDCGGLAEPPCRRDAYTQRDQNFSYRTIQGATVSGQVRLFLRSITDQITGQTSPDVPVTSRSVWDQHLERRGFLPAFSLNTLNYDAMSSLLVPRAVGYSAGLLDNFFRGKLAVRREPHPETREPSLRIVNRSPEPLGEGGVLTLYQDDQEGTRTPVPGATLTLATAVPKDNDASPIYFPLPADLPASGLTLVYQGKLGQEETAVIGKALTESRIERIYLDWRTNLWMLQTADALYALPLQTVAGLSHRPAAVQWGERDNQIVAYTFAPRVITTEPFEALLFEIERPLGSAQVPTTGAVTAQGDPVVALRLMQRIPLFETLGGIDLGTTVDFTEHLEFTQYGLAVTVNTTCTWDEGYGIYRCTSSFSGERMEPLRTLRDAVTAAFPLALTRERFGWSDEWYAWDVKHLWADRSGRLIALVQIQLAPLPWTESWRRFPLLAWSPSGPVESGYFTGMQAKLEEPGVSVLALVDLTAGRLLAKTSGDLIRIEKTQRRIQPYPTDSWYWPCYLDLRGETVYIGGYWDGQRMGPPYVVCQARSYLDSGRVVGSLPVEAGTRLDQLEGLWEARLAPLGLGEAVVQDRPPVPFFIRFNAAENALRVDRTVPSTLGPGLPSSWSSRLWWFGPAPGLLAFQADAVEWPSPAWPASQAKRMWLLQWDLEADLATPAYTDSGAAVAAAVSGTQYGVFLVKESDRTWRWVPWTGAPLVFPDRNPAEAWDYIALDATRLLNVRTGELHLLVPGLPPDPDSPPFAPGGARWDAYHIIGR